MAAGDSSPLRRGSRLRGRVLDGQLGARPGGACWRAWSPEDARSVAVKVLTADESRLDPDAFARVASDLLALDAPHVARVLDAGVEGDRLVLVTRLAAGPDLERLVRRGGPWEPGRAVRLVRQLAEGLDAVHRAGLVHAAVTPRNVAVVDPGDPEGPGSAQLLDLGLARGASAAAGRAQGPGLAQALPPDAAGAPGSTFLAPEARAGGEVGAPADVYGLAAILHLLVAGAAPGYAPTVRPGVYDERSRLLAVALRGLVDDPVDRPADVLALADAATVALEGESPLPEAGPGGAVPAADEAPQDPVAISEERDRLGAALVAAGADLSTSTSAEPAPSRHADADGPRRTARPARPRRTRLIGLLVILLLAAAVEVGALLWASRTEDGRPVATPPSTSPTPSTPSESPTTPTRARWDTLGPGDSGPPVRAAQLLMRAQRLQVRPTGRFTFTSGTRIRRVQRTLDVPVTGQLDGPTWEAMVRTLKKGDRGARVRAAQVLLRASSPKLGVDGDFGRATRRAVRKFQKQVDLKADGRVNLATWSALVRARG